MCALDIQPFGAISGVGVERFLITSMGLAQNTQGEINVDDILPHPTTVIRSVEFHARKARKRLEEEIKSVMVEQVIAVLTVGAIAEDHTKVSFSALMFHCVDSE